MINAVFIHIPKTAGTTVRTVLGCSEYRRLKNIPDNVPQHVSFGHLDYAHLVKKGYVDPEFAKSAFTFAFVRNPYDRTVSLYEYYRKIDKVSHSLSFPEFVWRLQDGVSPLGLWNQKGWSQCNPQVRWTEKLDLNFIGSFENLESEIRSVAALIGAEVPEEIPRLQKTIDRPMDYYYDETTRGIVEELYEEDFEEFGYDPVLPG